MFGVGARDIGKVLTGAKHCDPDALIRPEQIRAEIKNEYWPKDEGSLGDPFPWTFPFLFRPGQVTVWHGLNGSGKTVGINNCLAYWAWKLNRMCCIASLEWPSHETFAILGRIAMGKRKPDGEAEFNKVMGWLQENFLAYHKHEEAALEDILRVWAYAVKKYGCFHFVLDALLRIQGADVKELDVQRQIMNKLLGFADEYRVHVHLVAHSKKMDAKHDPRKCWPTKYDISGSSDIPNLAQNVICVWRNTGKEEAIYEANMLPHDDPDKQQQIQLWGQREDTLVIVQKQRKTGQEGHKRLWFDKEDSGGSFQFREDRLDLRAKRMLE
jgi:twinkle protein